MPKICYFFG